MENGTFSFENSNFSNNFNYNSLSGLGESDYENEDLFKENLYSDDINLNNKLDENVSETEDFNSNILNNFSQDKNDNISHLNDYNKVDDSFWFNINTNNSLDEETKIDSSYSKNANIEDVNENSNELDNLSKNNEYETTQNEKETINDNSETYNSNLDNIKLEEETNTHNELDQLERKETDTSIQDFENDEVEISKEENSDTNENNDFNQDDDLDDIEISDTPIEELEDLTKYDEENIEETDIGNLFDKVSVNVKEASDIFRRNTEMKSKIDKRFKELKDLQNDIETKRQNQVNEINSYKDEVFKKLTEKKDEIEKRLNMLKEMQSDLENEKKEFEEYRKEETKKIEDIKEEIQSSYDERREELNHVEELLRKQKDELDQERNQLSLDKIQYEADKNELANNLLKFNDLVDTFTNGVNTVKEDN